MQRGLFLSGILAHPTYFFLFVFFSSSFLLEKLSLVVNHVFGLHERFTSAKKLCIFGSKPQQPSFPLENRCWTRELPGSSSSMIVKIPSRVQQLFSPQVQEQMFYIFYMLFHSAMSPTKAIICSVFLYEISNVGVA